MLVEPLGVSLLDRPTKTIPGAKPLLLGLAFLLFCLAGCAPLVHTQAPTDKPAGPSAQVGSNVAQSSSEGRDMTDLQRLADLWHWRTQGNLPSDYPIVPGDVLEVSIPAMEEFNNRVVRVSGEGTIYLPFVGIVRAAGLSERELREEIRRRIEGYMYSPQVNLFVREHRSRQVAVLGAVARPGLYTLASGADTLLDMIGLAGGMRVEAAQRILFIPADPADNERARELAASLPVQLAGQDAAPLILKRTDPVTIDLNHFSRGAPQLYLSLPARPGDVLLVPGSGEVFVQGWVAKVGSYKVGPGLTVSGAVAAAGGPLFAADTSAVQVIRTGKGGERISLQADLEKIKGGEQADILVRDGDVVEVLASAPKLVPYSIYRFITSTISIGVGASVPLY
jgi:polysaccharide export outer membrane protein